MKKISSIFMTATVSLFLAAGTVHAKPSLWTYDRISKGLFDLAAADAIGERCSTISPRFVRGKSFALSLYSYAKSKGYTHDEVKGFIESDTEKAKLRKRVIAWFKSEGVDINNNQSFCPLGEREIAKKSQIGQLLYQ